jgi:hypothetical protein
MRHTINIFAVVLLAFIVGMSHRASAQVYDKTYAKTLILGGGPNGSDLTNILTLNAPALLLGQSLTLPTANAAGVITDVLGLGTLSWTTIALSSFTPASANTFLTTNGSGSLGWLGLNINATLTGNGLPTTNNGTPLAINLTNANTWSAAQTMQRKSIGTTSTDALVLTNSTAATSGTQLQYSPRMRLVGQGWHTTSAASQEVDWMLQAVPVAGAANPTSYLDFEDGLSNGSYASDFDLFSTGGASLGVSPPPTAQPPLGVLNVKTGFQNNGPATSGYILEGNGTTFVSSPAIFPNVGTSQSILRSNGTSFVNSLVNTRQYQFTTVTGTSNAVGTTTMMGLGSGTTADTISPNGSGIVMLIISGNILNASSSAIPNNSTLQLYYGSVTAPTNGYITTPLPGSTAGNLFTQQSHNGVNQEAFTMTVIISGLTVSVGPTTPYWFDIGITNTAGTGPVTIGNVSVSVFEL